LARRVDAHVDPADQPQAFRIPPGPGSRCLDVSKALSPLLKRSHHWNPSRAKFDCATCWQSARAPDEKWGSPDRSVGGFGEPMELGLPDLVRAGKDEAMARTTPDWEPENEEDYEFARSELKSRFAQWLAVVGIESRGDDGEAPIHYKWAYVDGHLTRWRCRDLDEIYLELHPAKVMLEDDDLDEVLEEAKNFIGFLDETGLLDPESDPADVLVDHLDAIEKQFRLNMADASRYSFGKRLWTTAVGEGVRLDDRASVEAFMANFNARPIAERDAILGPGLPPRPAATGKFSPPGRHRLLVSIGPRCPAPPIRDPANTSSLRVV
jgi:hypothetical protein